MGQLQLPVLLRAGNRVYDVVHRPPDVSRASNVLNFEFLSEADGI